MSNWKILGIECLADAKFLKLFRVSWQRVTKTGFWSMVSRKSEPECISQIRRPDAAVIVPLLRQADGSYVLVAIKQFRIPLGGYHLSFPAGLIDAGETADKTATRELFEECGLNVTEIVSISPATYASSGMTDESAVYVFVKCEGTPSNVHNEESEDIETLLIKPEEYDDVLALKNRFNGLSISAKLWPVVFGLKNGMKF